MKTFKKIAKETKLDENFLPNSFCGNLDGSKEEEHRDCDECALNTGAGDPLNRYLQIQGTLISTNW